MEVNKFIVETAAPAVEPVLIADFKKFLKVSGTEDDELLANILLSARIGVENVINRPLINTTYAQEQDNFEGYRYNPVNTLAYQQGVDYDTSGQRYIKLQKSPLVSVTSVITYSVDNVATTYSTDNYTIDISGGKVLLNESVTLPSSIRQKAGFKINFVAGFGATSTDVPYDLKMALMMYAQSMYDWNRPDKNLVADAYTIPAGAMQILKRYRLEIGLNG